MLQIIICDAYGFLIDFIISVTTVDQRYTSRFYWTDTIFPAGGRTFQKVSAITSLFPVADPGSREWGGEFSERPTGPLLSGFMSAVTYPCSQIQLGWPAPGSIQPMGARPMESYGLGLAIGTGPLHDGPARPLAARGPQQPLPPSLHFSMCFWHYWTFLRFQLFRWGQMPLFPPPIGSATVPTHGVSFCVWWGNLLRYPQT